ncbi:TonB-dependent receptor [Sphingomonas sp. UYAg733]
MLRPLALPKLLLMSSALIAPAVARAQSVPATTTAAAPTQSTVQDAPPAPADAAEQEQTDISIPGASNVADSDIVVVGRRNSNIEKSLPQVVSVLSSADIARTGEGDIAGALSRVTGLSVVGNGFVYVRGLGDRYSLALLNGSPLPSPEPLRRVVPLDLFPTSIIASSLVQKSYSVNFPGEFGGGVINLTTKSAPKEAFLSVGASIGADSVTTGQLGYTYFGSSSDWTGFDNGSRDTPPALKAFFASGKRISNPADAVDTQAIASQLVNGRNAVVQRNKALPPNWSAAITGGKSFDLGDTTLGVIATVGYSNKWRTRDTTQQTAASVDLSQKELDFERVITDDRVVVNGLLGLSLEFNNNKIRLTNLYIRDTLKQARIGIGTRATTSTDATLQQQDTAWFERQLIDTQLVGEFKLLDKLNLDVRAGYANSRRESPNEFSFEYFRSNSAGDLLGNYFINRLNGQQGQASVSYSNLNEDLFSGGLDLSYKVTPDITATIGYAYSDTNRRTERRDLQFRAITSLPDGVTFLRPDLLLEPAIIKYFGVALIDNNEGNPAFRAKLRNHAGYAQIQAQITPDLSLNAGVRYETAKQTVDSIQVFNTPTSSAAATRLNRNYWLPAGTVTLQLAPAMQLRVSASKTIARPQFRELVFQNYFDPDSNRQYRGNPFLIDSQLYNAEARYEWYFARDQRISFAGFYKKIDHPIEAFAGFSDNTVTTTFANAPRATLYGAEIETQKYFDLADVLDGSFLASRRAVLIANYTYSKSKVSVKADDPAAVFGLSGITLASQLFRDNVPLTGQSDHLANLELGLESKDVLSQQTFLLTYSSKRLTNRSPSLLQPDIYEKPGFRLDFVARQGVKIAGLNTEMKFEVRNITGTKYQELQDNGTNKIFYNRYDIGRSASFGLSVNF